MITHKIKQITYSAMFLALAFVMPFLTGQIPQIGSMLCPMHIPVLLCGYLCGPTYGLFVGFASVLLRSFMLSMPPLFPTAFCMSFELATYGFVSGLLFKRLPKKKSSIYLSLILAMFAGRIVWGMVMFGCMGFDISKFGLATFIAGAFTNAIPGIIMQIILVPIMVYLLNGNYKIEEVR